MGGGERDEQDRAGTPAKDGAPLRCHCGSLIARLVSQGVEIKCRRCKRMVVIPVNTEDRNRTDSRVTSR
jgi:phage FluMu protein Com